MDGSAGDSPTKAPSQEVQARNPDWWKKQAAPWHPGEHYAARSLLHEEATGLFHVLVTTPREVRDNHIARR